MKKYISKLSVVLIYFLLIAWIAGFKIELLFDIRGILAVLCGMVLFSIPVIITERNRNTVLEAFSKNAVTVGYLATFLFLFSRLNNSKGYDNLLTDVALNCRPLLYGLICWIFLKPDNKEKEEQQEAEAKTENDYSSDKDDKKSEEMSAEQRYYLFRAKGLTQREAEVARLACNNLSNREIAEQLYISETTVKKHMSHIFEKLGIASREELGNVLDSEKV